MEHNTGLQDLGVSEEFLDMTPKIRSIKEKKVNKLQCIKIHPFFLCERLCSGDQKCTIGWEKILANQVFLMHES